MTWLVKAVRALTLFAHAWRSYSSKMFNCEYLEGRGLPAPEWLAQGGHNGLGGGDDVDEALGAVLAAASENGRR